LLRQLTRQYKQILGIHERADYVIGVLLNQSVLLITDL